MRGQDVPRLSPDAAAAAFRAVRSGLRRGETGKKRQRAVAGRGF